MLAAGLLGAILVGSALAFVATEQAKLRRALLTDTQVDKRFSPSCQCRQDVARIAFRLPTRSRVTLQIVNATGRTLATLVHDRLLSAGSKQFLWHGRDAHGGLLPNGAYRPQVTFTTLHRTLVLPSPIVLDTRPPRLVHAAIVVVGRRLLVRYLFDESAQALLLIDGRRAELTRSTDPAGRLEWIGVFPDGRRVSRGSHQIVVAGIDLAGNRSSPSRPIVRHLG